MERLYDIIGVCFALPFQIALLVAGMSFVFHDWKKFAFCLAVVAVCSPGLYFFWYKNLKSREACREEDEIFRPIGETEGERDAA